MPEAVDHVRVVVDPREDRSWLQAKNSSSLAVSLVCMHPAYSLDTT